MMDNENVIKKQSNINFNMEEDENDYYNEESRYIPGIILRIWGKMTQKKYKSLLLNPSWNNLRVRVCMDCYLKFTLPHIETKTIRKLRET